jgi:serine/threonine kinase 32
MVQHKITKENFALKYLDKEDIIRKKMTKNILRERNLLQDLHHPLICNMKYSFQDDYNLYMVLDLMLGGDLRFHMNRRKFTEVEIVKIAAELIISISHLHKLKVIHR